MRGFVSRDVTPISYQFDTSPEGHRAGVLNSANEGEEEGDDKEVVILGRVVRWTKEGLEYEADPKHRLMVLESLGFVEGTRVLSYNGDKE